MVTSRHGSFPICRTGIVLLAMARTSFRVLVFVALLSLGMAFISPNLGALISKRGGQEVGTALGIQNTASSLGQAVGPFLGSVLFVWQINAPYLLTGALLLAVTLVIGWKTWGGLRVAKLHDANRIESESD